MSTDPVSPRRMAADRDLEAGRPVPDLLDLQGRLRRFGIAAALATLVAVLAGGFAYDAARADLESGVRYLASGAGRFVLTFTGVAWALAYLVARWWLDRRARARDGLVPGAAARLSRRR